jgi:hypothetical protein
LVKAGVSTLGTAAETFNYWDFPSQDYLICKTNGGITSFPCVTLQIAPTAPSVAVGSTVVLTVTASNSSGSIPTPPNLQWSSDTSSVATVDPSSGLVTGVSAGTATITVTDPVSQATASVPVTVTVTAAGDTYNYYFIFQQTDSGNTATISYTLSEIDGTIVSSGSQSFTYTAAAPGSCVLQCGYQTFGPMAITIPGKTNFQLSMTTSGGGSAAVCYVEFDAYQNGSFVPGYGGTALEKCESPTQPVVIDFSSY